MTSTPPSRTDRWVVWLATGLGVGRVLPAPGTWGSLWGLPLTWALLKIPSLLGQIGVLVGLFALGVPLCRRAARTLGVKDPGAVVWDELITVPIVFLGLTADTFLHPQVAVLGFALHRLFDITKPPPCRQLEHLPDGWGIMSDDVVAGVYGWMILQLVLRSCPGWIA